MDAGSPLIGQPRSAPPIWRLGLALGGKFSCYASAEYFQQCAEFLPICNRGGWSARAIKAISVCAMIETVSASSWRAGGAASRLTPPMITAWDCFQARARPLPRSPRRARGSRQARMEPTMTAPVQAPTKLEINVGDQLQDHQGSWSCFAGEVACPRRRGDRLGRLLIAVH